MNPMAKRELLKEIKPRYLKSDKREKGKILDEFCENTGYHRKYAINILQAKHENKVERNGRKSRKKRYGNAAIIAITKIWELLDYPCGTRLKPELVSTAEAMMRHNEIKIGKEIIKQLESISPSTIDRRLKKERKIRRLLKSRGTTRHGSLLKSSIPIRITNWNTNELGFAEMDTVAHNGGNPAGEFIYSLDLVEIYSGWSEQRAVMGKGEAGVIKKIEDIKSSMPFKIKGLDSDGGSEFINWHMVKYCKENEIFFTRSRPDMKNDNAYVEQKNRTHIREWLKYRRYDTQEQLGMINDLYENEMRLFNNFFRPVMKIKSKEKVNNSVCKKKYDKARTPYHRLINSDFIDESKKQELTDLYLSLNPVQLKKEIERKLKNIIQS